MSRHLPPFKLKIKCREDRYILRGCFAANTFTGLVNGNWNNIGNWSTAAVPTAADGNVATFDATSPNCTVDGGARVCNAIDFTGYTNTITMTNQITVSGNGTLGASMVIAGAAALLFNAAATLTSAGKVWPNALNLNGAVTYTLADNWDVDGLLSVGTGSSTNTTINGNQITASAGLTLQATTGVVLGTTNIILDGTGTVTGASSTGALRNNLTINTAGTITFANGGTFAYNTGTLTYTAGTVVTTNHTLSVAGSTTLATNGITWGAVQITGSVTVTLSNDLSLAGLLTLGSASGATVINGNTINAAAGIRASIATGSITGTTVLKLTGTGTVDAPSITSGTIGNPITLAAGAGTITIATAGDTAFRGLLNQLLFTSGTIITDAGTWASGSSGGMLVHPGMAGGMRG